MNIDLSRTQQYLDWLKDKIYLNTIASSAGKRTVFRGQVYHCKLGTGIGSEECKSRPCVILQYNSANKSSPNTIVAPITRTNTSLPVVIPIANKLDYQGNVILDGNVLLGNIVCISKARLGDYVTDLTLDEMKQVDKAISISLDLNRYYQTLKNCYDDKLKYIDKLKKIREDQNKQLSNYQKLLNQYHLSDIEELSKLLEKHGTFQ